MSPALLLLASFNGGPTDAQSFAALAVAVLGSIAAGVASRSIGFGAMWGALIGFLVCDGLLAYAGGFLGAEIAVLIFTVGGAVLGALAGGLRRLVRWWLAKS